LSNFVTELQDFFRHRLWQDEGRSPAKLLALKCLRVLVLSGRGLIHNQSLVRASSLAYATILGFIPLFALLFAILQAIGVPRLIATYTLEHLAPGSRQFATQILEYIEATKVTSLGVFGVVALLLDLVIVMTNVEKAFNKTWRVSRTRPWSRKVSDYLSIFLIFPILMAAALTFSTSFWGLQHVIQILSGIMPAIFFTATRWLVSLGLLWFAFIFIYLVIVNTKVNFWSAVLGGVIGGTVWQVAQWIFTAIQGGAAYYNAIYGALYNLLFRGPVLPTTAPLIPGRTEPDTSAAQQPGSSGYPHPPELQFGGSGNPGRTQVIPPVSPQPTPGPNHGQGSTE
jgi:membrane protein